MTSTLSILLYYSKAAIKILLKKGSMINKTTIRVGFTVNIVDCMQGIFETFVDPYPVALGSTASVTGYRLVHLGFLVNIS